MFNNHFLELLLALTKKEVKARYKHAVLGFLWIFINPLVQMIVLGFVFSLIFKFGIKNYYLFLFSGLLPWNFFSLSINKATPRIVWDRNLIQKSNFPRETIPLSMVLSHFFHFCISWLMLIVFLVITSKWQFFNLSTIICQFSAIFLLLIFTAGLSLITSSLSVFYRDIIFVVQTTIMLWFYATPVIYPLSAVPKIYQWVFYFNPLLTVFTLLQKSLVETNLPPTIFSIHIIIILSTLIFGWMFFRKKAKYFTDWL